MTWGEPVVETASHGTAVTTKVMTNLPPEEVDFNWDMVDFLTSQEFVPQPSLPSASSSFAHVDDFKQRQKEELERFLQQQKEEEQAFLIQQREEEARRKQQEEIVVATEKKEDQGQKENSETPTVTTVLLDILAELRSLKQMYQTSLSQPKRKRPSRAKQPNPTVTTSAVPPLVISTKSLTGTSSPEVGLGSGKGLRQLKMVPSRF